MRTINLGHLFVGDPKVTDEELYREAIREQAGIGREVTLTGAVPPWLYMVATATLADRVRTLWYDGPGIPRAVLVLANTESIIIRRYGEG